MWAFQLVFSDQPDGSCMFPHTHLQHCWTQCKIIYLAVIYTRCLCSGFSAGQQIMQRSTREMRERNEWERSQFDSFFWAPYQFSSHFVTVCIETLPPSFTHAQSGTEQELDRKSEFALYSGGIFHRNSTESEPLCAHSHVATHTSRLLPYDRA